MERLKTNLALLLGCILSSGALATDGVLEINQVCATQMGCFSGDTASYPVVIDGSAGKSYILTSDLVLSDPDLNGLEISASGISIDMNGFQIISSSCVGTIYNCKPDAYGEGSGIRVTSGDWIGVSVSHGSIVGMSLYGIWLSQQSSLIDMKVRWNRLKGVDVGSHSRVQQLISYENGTVGIYAHENSLIVNSIAFRNTTIGIRAGHGSTVTGNISRQNLGDGIYAGDGANVLDNTVKGNGGYGLNLNATAGYRGNVVTENTTGTINSGISMGVNVCNTDTTCP